MVLDLELAWWHSGEGSGIANQSVRGHGQRCDLNKVPNHELLHGDCPYNWSKGTFTLDPGWSGPEFVWTVSSVILDNVKAVYELGCGPKSAKKQWSGVQFARTRKPQEINTTDNAMSTLFYRLFCGVAK